MPPNSDPYEWQTTAGCPAGGGAFKHWPNMKPFGIESSSQFRANSPPKLTSGEYARDYNEVQAIGEINSSQRPQDRTNVAQLYNAQAVHYGWNSVLRQIASGRNDSITSTARTAAVMNMSISDAFITVFETKYFYTTWRPVTAIPRGAEDGNQLTGPSAFTPLILTPCFPELPLGAWGGNRLCPRSVGKSLWSFQFSDDVASQCAGNSYPLHRSEGHHRRCLRRPCVWRHSLPLRSGCRRTARQGCWSVH